VREPDLPSQRARFPAGKHLQRAAKITFNLNHKRRGGDRRRYGEYNAREVRIHKHSEML
jgi:hypothetical protein